jgi:hypothetical protein
MIGAMRHAFAMAMVLAISTVASAETHKFKPTTGVTTFAARPPALTIKPGDTVETETFSKPGDYYDPKVAGPWPGEVGPFLRPASSRAAG